MRPSREIFVSAGCLALITAALITLDPTVGMNQAQAADSPNLLQKLGTSTGNFFKGLFGGGTTATTSTTVPAPTGQTTGANKPTGVTRVTASRPSTGGIGNVPSSVNTGYSGTTTNMGYSKSNPNIGYGSKGPVGYSAGP